MLDSFSLFLHFLTSLIKHILWLKFFPQTKIGWSHGRQRLCVGSCCFINSRPLQQLFLLTETLTPSPLLVSNILWVLVHISPSYGSLHQIPYFKIFFKNGSPMLLLGLNFPTVCFSIYHIFFSTVFIAPRENVIKVHWLCIVRCSAAQSCLTLCDPVDCSPPGSSVQGGSPSKNIGVGCHDLLQGTFPTQGLNLYHLRLLHCSQILDPLSHLGSPHWLYIRLICQRTEHENRYFILPKERVQTGKQKTD